MRKIIIAGFAFFLIISNVRATSVRIIGMGSLELIVEDETNRVNLFDYGKNVAGFYRDEVESSIEAYITRGNISNSDSSGTGEPEVSYWGVNLPYLDFFSALIDLGTGVNTFSSEYGIPAGVKFNYRTEDGFAIGGSGAYSSSNSRYESWDREDKVSMPLANILFSKDFGVYSTGAAAGFGKITYANKQDSSEMNASLKGFELGGAMHLSPMFDVGIVVGMAFPGADLEDSWYKQSFQGNVFSMGVQSISRIPGLLKLGVRFGGISSSLSGRTTVGNVSIESGDVNNMNFDFDSKVLFSSILTPMRAVGNIRYRKIHTTINDSLLLGVDNYLSVTNLGFGVSYALPFLTPGIQANIRNQSLTDNLGNRETMDSNMWSIRFGAELDLSIMSLRVGYVTDKEDPDRNVENDERNSRSITLGTGLSLPFKIDIAYVNKETKPLGSPTKSKETDNAVYSALNFTF